MLPKGSSERYDNCIIIDDLIEKKWELSPGFFV